LVIVGASFEPFTVSSLQLLIARKSVMDCPARPGRPGRYGRSAFASRAAGFNQWSYGIPFSGGSSGIAAVANTHRSVAAVLEALLAIG
jgi:hypothetical protein